MFGWNISKSAEAMLSRSVIRRLCKFLLKKKLGEFICGDIDLDQLDVQLGEGTIQLKDLALNVDYLNQKVLFFFFFIFRLVFFAFPVMGFEFLVSRVCFTWVKCLGVGELEIGSWN